MAFVPDRQLLKLSFQTVGSTGITSRKRNPLKFSSKSVNFTSHVAIYFTAELQMELIRPQTGAVEMDQDLLWEQVQQTIKEAIQGEVLIN